MPARSDELRAAVKLNPKDLALRVHLARALLDDGHPDAAITQYEAALQLDPRNHRIAVNLGDALYTHGHPAAGIAMMRRAAAQAPADPIATRNLATMLTQSGNPAEAVQAAEAFARLNLPPGLFSRAEQLLTLGTALLANEQHAPAQAALRDSIAADPNLPEAKYTLAVSLLARGQWHAGLELFRARLQTATLRAKPRVSNAPEWTEPLADPAALRGKRILLTTEQGAGDAIQFARFIPDLTDLGTEILLHCPPAVAPLFSRLPLQTTTHQGTAADPIPPHDLTAALMDLPWLLGLAEGDALLSGRRADPYLHADPARVDVFRGRLPRDRRLKVGVCWSGNPRQVVNPKRAMDPKLLAKLRTDRTCLVSLQKDPSGPLPRGMVDLMPHVHDFADTAALLSAVDVVVTTDTSIAHLAGALGLKAHILLHAPGPHWCWSTAAGLDPRKSRWYPTLHLHRQPSFGDWTSVLSQVATALSANPQ